MDVFEGIGADSEGTITSTSSWSSNEPLVPGPVPVRECSPPTRWLRLARPSACRSPGRPSVPAVDPRLARLRRAIGRGGDEAPRGRHPSPADHDPACLRERHHHGHGPRRLDQCRPPSPRHRPRGGGRPGAGRLRPDLPVVPPTSAISSRSGDTTWSISIASEECRSSCEPLLDEGLLHRRHADRHRLAPWPRTCPKSSSPGART